MKNRKILSFLLIATMIFTSLSIPVYGIEKSAGKKDNNRKIFYKTKLDEKLLEKLDDKSGIKSDVKGETIDVIVHMKKKANTEKAKEKALDTSYGNAEVIERKAVIGSLRETAEKTQERLIEYLKQEKRNGTVETFESFYIINAVHVKADKKVIEEIAKRDDVEKIYENGTVKAIKPIIPKDKNIIKPASFDSESEIEWGIKDIGADRVWKDFGVDGTGVTVGIIDTGAYVNHPAIKNKWRGYDPLTKKQTAKGNYIDYVDGKLFPDAKENNDHGTHVAGTIAGEMKNSDGGKYNRIGVAPGAKFISARAFNEYGGGHAAILKCAEWMLAPGGKAEDAPDIINNSWGGDNNTDTWFKEVIKHWREANIMPVFAAGNLTAYDKAEPGTITNPGSLKEAFAVGAIGASHRLASFSKWGPSNFADTNGRIKPEIVAPGVQIRSCLATGGFASWNGTSMATPHISGVAALMKSADKSLTVEKMESILKETASGLTDNNFKEIPNMGYGYGEVSAYDAVARVLGKNTGIIKGSVKAEGEDKEKPVIFANFDKTAFKNRDFKVSAEVSDNIAIIKVRMSYSTDEGNTWKDVDMDLKEGDAKKGKYEASIPKKAVISDNLRVKISAWDYGSESGVAEETPAINIPVVAGIDPTNYKNDFEDDISGWMFDGVWNVGSPVGAKEPEVKSGKRYAGTDVGKNDYLLRVDSHMYLPPIDLSKANGKAVVLKYQEYLGVDPATYCSLQYSKDGVNYMEFDTRERGLKTPAWEQVSYNLSEYSSGADFLYLRFKLQGPPKDAGPGWYVDDVEITVDSKIIIDDVKGLSIRKTGGGVRLNWDAGHENNISGYKIYRKETGKDDGSYEKVGETGAIDVCEFEDKGIREGKYTYKVVAFDSLGNESGGSLIQIDYVPLKNVIYADFNSGKEAFSGDGDWECGVPVRTAGSDPYTTLYQKEYGLFEKMKNNDGLWGTQLEGKMTGRTYSALESPEIQIPENADDSVLEFSSYNTINFVSLNSNIQFKVEVSVSGNTWTEIVGADEIMPFSKNSKWVDMEKSLKPYAGQKVKFRFIADSLKQAFMSKYELGWYIDNFRVGEKTGVIKAKTGGITGRVSSGNGQDSVSMFSQMFPLSGERSGSGKYIPLNATVRIKETGKHVQTNFADGKFYIKHAESIKGAWTLVAEAYGFFPEERAVMLGAGETKIEDFKLKPKGKGGIGGVVKNEKGESVPNAFLRIKEDSNYGIIKADSQGKFQFDDIYEGTYTLKAFKDGFEAADNKIDVKAGKISGIDMQISELEHDLVEESMNRDNGKCADQFIYSKVADGPKGYAVKYRPHKKGGILKSMTVFIPDSKSTNKDMSFGVLQHSDTGRLIEIAHFRKENLKPGSWNEISFAQDNIRSDRTFYLVALQNHNAPDTLTVGIDSNKEIGTDGSKASYMFNGAFTPLERYQKYGALMIRANMLYRKNAKENPPDPNEWEGGSGGNTPIVEPDDESAFVFDTGEYNNSGVKGFIKAYKGESEVIIIPGVIGGKPVKAIGAGVFRNKNIKQVQIPEGIEIIGENAFNNNFIQEITIPSSVKNIEDGAFSGNALKKLYIPENVTKLGKNAFSKNRLGEVTGMKGITEIPSRAFFVNPEIKMHIPNVAKIADDAFGPVNENRKYALLFTGNGNSFRLSSKEGEYIVDPAKILMSLYDVEVKKFIKKDIEIIGDDGHGNSPKDYSTTNPLTHYYVMSDREVEIKSPKLAGYSNIEVSKKVKLENAVNKIKFNYSDIELMVRGPLFENDKKIMALGKPDMKVEIKVNGSVKGSGRVDKDGYFEYNIDPLRKGTEIVLVSSDDAGNINESEAFKVKAKPVQDTQKPGADIFILDSKGYLLRYLGNDKDLVIPSSIGRRTITKIAPLTFCNMGIKSVNFSGNTGLDEIGNAAFAKNELTSVIFPNRLLHYGKKSFEYNKLESVQLSPHAHVVNENAFHANKIREVGIPGSLTHIRPGAFMDNMIEFISFPKRIETVESYSFANNKLKQVVFDEPAPGEVTGADEEFEELGEGVFSGNDLTEVKLPATVKDVPDNAFADNNRIVNIITLNGEVKDSVDGSHFGHIVNGARIKFNYKKENGEELSPSEILVGKGLRERKISDPSMYFRAGRNVEIQPKDINNYSSSAVKADLKSGILNEVTFVYKRKGGGGGYPGGSGGGGGTSPGGGGSSPVTPPSEGKNKPDKSKDDGNISTDKDIQADFSDIKRHWSRQAVLYAVKRGYFKGVSKDLFDPDRAISRGEFVTVLGRMSGVKASDYRESVFKDVNITVYCAPYIGWAYKEGIIKGYADKTFKADNKISREEMAVICRNFIDHEKIAIPEGAINKSFAEFTDMKNIGNWAADSVVILQKAGLVKGDGKGAYMPKAEFTRAESAQLLYNLDKLAGKGY